jgi:hypothetical protein
MTKSGRNDPNHRHDNFAERVAPDTFTELDLDNVRGLVWDNSPTRPANRSEPTQRELEILEALWSHRFLFATQIWRNWWAGSSQRAAQQGLNRMTSAGWVRRFKFRVGERGAQQRVYCLAKDGFALAQQHAGRNGPYIDPEETWRESQITDPRRILRDLHVNGWVLALQSSFPRATRNWRGQRTSRLRPLRRRVRGEWMQMRPSDVTVGTNSRLLDLPDRTFEEVTPDAIVELRVPLGERTMRLDLLVEIDRARSQAATEERLLRYDAFLTGWARLLDRYGKMGITPVVVFVCEDEPSALKVLRAADQALTGRIAKAGTEETEWPVPGRRSLFVAVERAMHHGSLEAFALPEYPPDVRVRLEGPKAKACRPRRVHIVEPRLLANR